MRLREFLFGTALMSIALVTTKASAPTVLGDDCRPDFADDAGSIVETTHERVTPVRTVAADISRQGFRFCLLRHGEHSAVPTIPVVISLVGPLRSRSLMNSSAGSGRTLSQWASACACQDLRPTFTMPGPKRTTESSTRCPLIPTARSIERELRSGSLLCLGWDASHQTRKRLGY